MNIGVEANSYYKNTAGSGVFARNILNAWLKDRKENTFTFFTLNRQSRMDMAQKKNIFSRIFHGFYDILWMQVFLPIRLIFGRADVLFCPASFSPIFAPCAVVATIFDMSYRRYPQTCDFLFRTYLRMLTPLTAKKMTAIITISQHSKKEIIHFLKIPEEKINVVYCGYNRELYKVIPEQEKIERIKGKYHIEGRYVLNVGTLEPRKNVAILIDAFDRLRKSSVRQFKLVLCGTRGWYYENIFQRVHNLNLDRDVVFTGHVPDEDLPLLYNGAEVFVFPSLYEGFGLPILEAMACGCPVVTSSSSSLPEVIGDAGLLINPQDTNGFANAIRTILDDQAIRENFRQKGLLRAQLFSWEKAATEILTVVQNAKAST